MARLEITTGEPRDGPHRGGSADILLDGRPIEDVLGGVRSVDLRVAQGEVISARISFFPDGVEVDAGIMAELEARLDERQIEPAEVREALAQVLREQPINVP